MMTDEENGPIHRRRHAARGHVARADDDDRRVARDRLRHVFGDRKSAAAGWAGSDRGYRKAGQGRSRLVAHARDAGVGLCDRRRDAATDGRRQLGWTNVIHSIAPAERGFSGVANDWDPRIGARKAAAAVPGVDDRYLGTVARAVARAEALAPACLGAHRLHRPSVEDRNDSIGDPRRA